MNLRTFLMRHPRPSTVRIQTLDGEEKAIAIDGRLPWVQIAGYVESLEPESLECLDADGRVLRGTLVADLEEGGAGDDGLAVPGLAAAQPLTARMKPPDDPQSAQLVLFAQLLADAYRHTTDVAFDKMISLFEQVNKRYELTEKALDRLHKTVERLTEQRITRAEQEPDDLTLSDLAQAWQGGMAQHDPAPQPQRPNGPPAPRREPPPPGYQPNGRPPSA